MECALHENDSLKPVMVEGKQRFGAETAPKFRWYGPLKPGVNAANLPLARFDRPPPRVPAPSGQVSDRSKHVKRPDYPCRRRSEPGEYNP